MDYKIRLKYLTYEDPDYLYEDQVGHKFGWTFDYLEEEGVVCCLCGGPFYDGALYYREDNTEYCEDCIEFEEE